MPGRPPVSEEIKGLIRKMSEANVGWGAPRIVGELRKLWIDVSKSTVEKCRVGSKKPPSPAWKAFLENHVRDLVSVDFFMVPTVRFKVLFELVVLAHHRRKVVHFNATEIPTAQWPVSRSLKLYRGIRHPDIYCGIGIVFTVPSSSGESKAWASKRCSLRRQVLGRMRLWNA